MPDTQKDFLFTLVKSLSRSEKRQFKLYVNRLGINADAKFLLLFEILDKMNEYNEKKIFDKKITSKQQLSNLKAHLYKQILISLRLNPIHHHSRIIIREQLDFAAILYQKGLYKQSLKLLDKAKQLALKQEEKNMAYEIIEFEKIIESQHITRSRQNRAEELISQAKQISRENVIASKLSNISLRLYSFMLLDGYVQSEEKREEILYYFEKAMPKYEETDMGFREQLWLNKAYLWKSLLLQNYKESQVYAQRWVELFYQYPEMIISNPVWFIKGNGYLLESLFVNKQKKDYKLWLKRFEKTIEQKGFPCDENVESMLFVNYNTALLNYHFLEGNFFESIQSVEHILDEINKFEEKIDAHYISILYFKISALEFISENYEETIKFTQKITEQQDLTIREDLYFHSRILELMSKFESGLDEDIEQSASEALKFQQQMKNTSEAQHQIALFFTTIFDCYPSEQKNAFQQLLETLRKLSHDPNNRRSLMYLDIISWSESKIQRRGVGEVIQEKLAKLS